jgi:nucleoid-associated protein YgaU
MKTMLKIAMIAAALGSMLVADIPILPVQLVSDADAILGVRRRTRRRTAVVVGTTAHAAGVAQGTAAAQQQAAAAKQPAPAAPAAPAPAAPAAPAPAAPAAPAPAAAGTVLPMGAVVAMLPAGCVTTPVGGVEYYHCGGNFYRAVFQGNSLVYVTAQPK